MGALPAAGRTVVLFVMVQLGVALALCGGDDANCSDPAKPYCQYRTDQCKKAQCWKDIDCNPNAKPYCSNKKCTRCRTNADGTTEGCPDHKFCRPSGWCSVVQCTRDKHCSGDEVCVDNVCQDTDHNTTPVTCGANGQLVSDACVCNEGWTGSSCDTFAGCPSGKSPFQIELDVDEDALRAWSRDWADEAGTTSWKLRKAVNAQFDAATDRWNSIVKCEPCGTGGGVKTIPVEIMTEDDPYYNIGDGGVLAYADVQEAQDCPSGRYDYTSMGLSRVDPYDIVGLLEDDRLELVMTHELGHIVAFIRSILSTRGGNQCCSDSDGAWDGALCPNVLREYRSLYPGDSSESPGLMAQGCAHWSDNVFYGELMDPTLYYSLPNHLGRVSIAALEDSGYVVDYSQADDYELTPAAAIGKEKEYGSLGKDVFHPIYTDDGIIVPVHFV